MLYLIAAVSDNNVIGIDNDLPWRLKNDLRWFRMHTLQGAVIMGRNTWASLPCKPLKNRLNIILTRAPPPNGYKNVIWKNSLAAAITCAYEHTKRVYIIGGSEVFHEAFAYRLHGIILTRVHCNINGKNTKELTLPEYKKLIYRSKKQCEKNTTYHFELWIF
jgi:dihydrofolate reductase